MNAATAQYAARGRKYLEQASEELARAVLEQASEKAWGAASQMLKAIAAERQWVHGQHRHLYVVARRLAEEMEDDEVRINFGLAGELHTNFYEGYMDADDVEFNLGKVSVLVERVEEWLANGSA